MRVLVGCKTADDLRGKKSATVVVGVPPRVAWCVSFFVVVHFKCLMYDGIAVAG